ncbi:hypothetical protein [Rhizobium leguminosarum]|uniref:hypothetical protein n=1 Tax=Rhizobium leguminosarum TaxID=384 RepID=UPI00103B1F48|nr:hypothetical protein [Rhizobium leguminosarum]TBY48312.1 hypothetical protein E0H54_10220 [Rhizobium leguminosarum bv. viciae]
MKTIAITVIAASLFSMTSLAGCQVARERIAKSGEMIKNGGFDDTGCEEGHQNGCRPWDIKNAAGLSSEHHSGRLSAIVGGFGTGAGTVAQDLSLDVGTYQLSFWWKHSGRGGGDTPAVVRVAGRTVFAKMFRPGEPDMDWEQHKIAVHIDKPTNAKIVFSTEVAPNNSGPLFLVDDARLTRSGGPTH